MTILTNQLQWSNWERQEPIYPNKYRPFLSLENGTRRKAKATLNSVDFTKVNALYNAALVRSRLVNHELGEDEILQRIVETYRTFLYAFTDNNEDVSADEIRNEIRHHKDFLANERRMIKERVDEIDSRFDATGKSDEQYQV